MEIDDELIAYVAGLSRIELAPGEVETFKGHLSRIIGYVEKLRELNVEGVAPLAHPLGMTGVFREDNVVASPGAEAMLSTAPERRGDYYSVPPVVE